MNINNFVVESKGFEDKTRILNSSENYLIKKILLVKDDPSVRQNIHKSLLANGYQIQRCSSKNDAYKIFAEINESYFDLLIIDLTLDKSFNSKICEKIRSLKHNTPLLIISDLYNEDEIVNCFENGADDCLIYPFSIKEFNARCSALIRRGKLNIQKYNKEIICFLDICIFEKEYRITKRGVNLNLSPKEYKIIKLFIKNPKEVLKRDEILERIWGVNINVDPKTIDVHIRWIREKIEDDPSNPIYIKTVRGAGYIFG